MPTHGPVDTLYFSFALTVDASVRHASRKIVDRYSVQPTNGITVRGSSITLLIADGPWKQPILIGKMPHSIVTIATIGLNPPMRKIRRVIPSTG
jgi:hypothetical protein